MLNIFGDNNIQITNMVTLENLFDSYREKHKNDLFKNFNDDTGYGKSFSCFATSVILYSLFGSELDIGCSWTDRCGDGKIDGIAIAINNKLFTHSGHVETFREDIKTVDLYFIQSKKHNSKGFSKEDFIQYERGIKEFCGNDNIADPNPNESIKEWLHLWKTIKKKIKKIEKEKRPKVNIHIYYAIWVAKTDYSFSSEENNLKQELINEAGFSAVNFIWADRNFLEENTIKAIKNNKKIQNNNDRPNSLNGNKEKKSSVTIKIDIGKISFYDENKGFGFIESKNNGSIYFHKTNFSNITCFLKTDTEVKFQFSKNLRQNDKCNYSVFKQTLEILG